MTESINNAASNSTPPPTSPIPPAPVSASTLPVMAIGGGVVNAPVAEYLGDVKITAPLAQWEIMGEKWVEPNMIEEGEIVIDPNLNIRWGNHSEDRVKSMAQALATQGQLQPVGLMELGDSGRYLLVFGHRRVAGWLYGLKKNLAVPGCLRAVVLQWMGEDGMEFDPSTGAVNLSKELLAGITDINVGENAERAELSLMDRIWAAHKLELAGFARNVIAKRLGLDNATITRLAEAVYFPPDVQEAIHEGRVREVVVALWCNIYRSIEEKTGKSEKAGKFVAKLAAKFLKGEVKHDAATERELEKEAGSAGKPKKKKTAKDAAKEAADAAGEEDDAATKSAVAAATGTAALSPARTPEEWTKLLKAVGKTRIVVGSDDIARILGQWIKGEEGCSTPAQVVQQLKSVAVA